jgi:hypothetical protein
MEMEHLPTKAGTRDMGNSGFPPHTGSHMAEYQNLVVHALTQEMAGNTAGPYFYTVTTYGFTAHTAFRERRHLEQWLEDLGLKLTEELTHESGKWTTVEGRYRRTSHFSYDEFYVLRGKRTRVLDNGEYTLGILLPDDDGVMNLHHLNCNLFDRPLFEHAASRALVG